MLADRLWIVEDGSFRRFDGTFEEYLASQRPPEAPAASPRPRLAPPARPGERRRQQAISRLEAEIDAAEREMAELGDQVNEASARRELERLAVLGVTHSEVESRLERLLTEWAGLQA